MENLLGTSPWFKDGKWGKLSSIIIEPNPKGIKRFEPMSSQCWGRNLMFGSWPLELTFGINATNTLKWSSLSISSTLMTLWLLTPTTSFFLMRTTFFPFNLVTPTFSRCLLILYNWYYLIFIYLWVVKYLWNHYLTQTSSPNSK